MENPTLKQLQSIRLSEQIPVSLPNNPVVHASELSDYFKVVSYIPSEEEQESNPYVFYFVEEEH